MATPTELGYCKDRNIDLLPTSRTKVNSGKSVNMENDGYEEEQIHRRANHRVHQAG